MLKTAGSFLNGQEFGALTAICSARYRDLLGNRIAPVNGRRKRG